MKVAVMVPRLSSRAGGLAFSIPPIVHSLSLRETISVAVIGIDDLPSDPDQPKWAPHQIPIPRSDPFTAILANRMGQALAELTPDLVDVQSMWSLPSLANWRYSSRSGTPWVITPRGTLDPWALRQSIWLKRLVMMLLERRHFESAGCVRALNACERDAIRTKFPDVPIATIPNGVHLPNVAAEEQDGDERQLLFLGRIHPKKGVEELVNAWLSVAKEARTHGWRLRLVGWGDSPYVDKFKAQIASLNSEESRIVFDGPAFGEAKAKAYRESAAFVLPSFGEGLPMAVLEAWSYALPSLLTPSCNLPVGFETGAAIKIEPNADCLAGALKRLFAMKKTERDERGLAARGLIAKFYSVEAVAEQCFQMYSWLHYGGTTPEFVSVPGDDLKYS